MNLNPSEMNAKDVMEIAEARGFKVLLKDEDPPMPFLRGPADKVTEPLIGALKAYREEIIPILRERQKPLF